MHGVDLLTQWSRLLIETLARSGIRHAVLSPGSRSTPLTWAVAECSSLTHSVVLDERSAAFTALGYAKYSGQPCLLVCTSGTAAANYLPAIVEASQSHTPLVVVTADRPFELQRCDAPQTMDQVKLYGDFVRGFFDLGMPDESLGALRALRRSATQAVSLALTPDAGPVHLNFRARKPLEPVTAAGSELATRVQTLLDTPVHAPLPSTRVAASAAIKTLAQRCHEARRGVITAGPLPPHGPDLAPLLERFVQATGFSLLCETPSQLRHGARAALTQHRCDSFDWILATPAGRSRFTPDFVLQLGPPLTSGAWHQLLSSTPELELHVLCESGWPDPEARARSVLQGSLTATLQALLEELNGNAPVTNWQNDLFAANTATHELIDGFAKEHQFDTPQREACAVRTLVETLPDGALLLLGNSLPVREIDQYVSGSSKRLEVISQRGANGIDGITSTAIGAAAQHFGPSVCLLGDVSFLHDIGGLWAARDLDRPLLIAVLNNGGGRIFEQLPLLHDGQLPAKRRDLWLTQHALNLSAAAELYGLRGERVDTAQQLGEAVQRALTHPGATVLDIRVDPDSARVDRDQLLARCETLLSQS